MTVLDHTAATSAVDVSEIRPIAKAEARSLAETEYARWITTVEQLEGDDWSKPTDCSEWDVRAMVVHVLGAMHAAASMREMVHQARRGGRWAKQHHRPLIDGMNAVQVAERENLAVSSLAQATRDIARRAVRGRYRVPTAVRRTVRMTVETPAGKERWTLGQLLDIYTRDSFIHRVDIARATGRELRVTPDHEGRVIEDVVADWAGRHRRPFTLELTGPLAASYRRGGDGEHIRIDAIEFCRAVSFREHGAGLLAQGVPF